jgi:hypothetical protein
LNNTTWNLSWNAYEGVTNGGYTISRGTSPTNMTVIAQIASRSLNTFTDMNAPGGQLYYQVALLDQPNCTPSARLQAGSDWSVRSNVVDNGQNAASDNWLTIQVWPNPVEGTSASMMVNSNSRETISIEIVDLMGRSVYRTTAIAGSTNSIGENIPTGSYEIRATLNDGTVARTRMIRIK